MSYNSLAWFSQSSQIPLNLSAFSLSPTLNTIWLDTLLLPAYVAALSALWVLIKLATCSRNPEVRSDDNPSDLQHGNLPYCNKLLLRLGGRTRFTVKFIQLLHVFALLAISSFQLTVRIRDTSIANTSMTVAILQCALYAYLALLALFAVFGGNGINRRSYAHLSWILALTWSVYIYRDVWPLATLDLSPVDAPEGLLVWVKLALLTVSGVVIPLLIPRTPTPMNPKDNIEPSLEQVASLWSLLTYSFLSPIVWLAYRIPHLSYEMLPSLPEYDYLNSLVGRSFPRLDPTQTKSRRHLALRMIRVFWVELSHLAAMSITAVIAAFAAPISINQLLIHFESGGAADTVQPWFWILFLLLGSVFKTISDQWFVFMTTRISIRVQAVVTELVFEHALRIRMKAETADAADGTRSGENTAVVTPDSASHVEPERDSSDDGGDNDTEGGAAHSATSSTATAVDSTAATKGKGKEVNAPSVSSEGAPQKKAASEPVKVKEDAVKNGKNLVGRINNLVSSDLTSLESLSMQLVFTTLESPFQIILCMFFLHRILGWSAWVGFAVMLVTLPVPGYITKRIQGTQREKMKRTDARVQLVTEMMNLIRMIKLFGWESRISQQLDEKREEELASIRRNKMFGLSNNLCNYLIPILIMLATFTTYTLIMKETLTASKVFSAMSVFDMLRMDINATFFCIPLLVQGKVSIERIQDFLENTEVIDEFEKPQDDAVTILAQSVPQEHAGTIGIRHASFTWTNDAIVSETPGGTRRRVFVLNVDDEVFFRRGRLNLVIGPTGAGKTSLLMALLGEMHYRPAGPDSFVSLPRGEGVAYAAQESWVQSDTIKNNIVFGARFDEARYNKVIEQCALRRDLELFDAGDQTEVGEKGITLSGGQKARITLARAVYSDAQIVLMDDILAALDVHTSRWIVDKCLKGDLLRGRTIILVTHNVAMVSPIADFVVDIGSDGRILSQGSLSNVLAHDAKMLKEVQEEQEEMKKVEQEIDQAAPVEEAPAKSAAGKLVVAEEMQAGHVGWKAMVLYIGNMSKRPVLFWMIYISGHIVRHFVANFQTWYLGYWASQYEIHPPEEVHVSHYLIVYTLFVLVGMVAAAFCVFYYVFGSIRAGKIVHQKLVTSVLGTTLRWLDKTPTARIIARCTDDIQTLDGRIARSTELLVEIFIFLMLKLFSVIIFTPIFIIPAIAVAVAGVLCGNIYMKAQLSVKREMSNAKAPVLSHFGAAVSGITSIRAYGAQEVFKREAYKRINKYSRIAITHENLNRWVTVRIDLIGTAFATGLATYLTYFAPLSASNTGFSLNMAAAFSSHILWCIRMFNEFEIAGNSLERIQQYLEIEQELKPTPEGVPPAYWPASGRLEVQSLSARYSPDGPRVLHEVSFDVASGERVGIVGRTGSGKSSLTLALLRCILTDGSVRFDGLPTEKINLDALRSSVTIIPQVPELLSGTLRQNLDPFSEHDDAVLNDALRSAGLFNLQEENDQSRITLDSEIAGGGANLSVGQRQVLALARAIVRRSKLLILDEATSAIDYETDSIIQSSLRTELGKDVTLLTVAHRLQTIMDADKIMVLDAGRIVEFGKPSELLRNEKGMLRALVDESGDREKLYAMATGA